MRRDKKDRPQPGQQPPQNKAPAAYRLLKDGRIDGRSLRRSGRTENLSVRVAEGFTERVKYLALLHGIRMGELVMDAVNNYRPELRKQDRKKEPSPG